MDVWPDRGSSLFYFLTSLQEPKSRLPRLPLRQNWGLPLHPGLLELDRRAPGRRHRQPELVDIPKNIPAIHLPAEVENVAAVEEGGAAQNERAAQRSISFTARLVGIALPIVETCPRPGGL